MSDIVTGNLDADKLDYMRRDSYHIGANYGTFDLDRVIHTLGRTRGRSPRLATQEKGIPALENYRLSRYLLHAQVYKHHARLAAEQMFLNAVDASLEKPSAEPPVDLRRLKVESPKFIRYYTDLDDASIYPRLLRSGGAPAALMSRIRSRRLYKRIGQFDLKTEDPILYKKMTDAHQSDLQEQSRSMEKQLGLDPYTVALHKSKIDINLYDKEDFTCLSESGSNVSLSSKSPLGITKPDMTTFYVYAYPEIEKSDEIKRAVADYFDVKPSELFSRAGRRPGKAR